MPGDSYDEISFSAEGIGGGEKKLVRVTKEPINDCRRLAARDIIAVGCGKDVDAAGLAWRRIKKSAMMAQLNPYYCEFNFLWARQQATARPFAPGRL